MNPVLYAPDAQSYGTLGIGVLTDCISCEVSEERNGAFELEMQYPSDGIHYVAIQPDAMLKAKPNETAGMQLFRIYRTSKPINGVVTINAEHVSYRLSHIPVSTFTANSATGALSGLVNNSAVDNPFTVWTDISDSGAFSVDVPSSFRSRLGGNKGSVLDVFGGEYEWDNHTIKLHARRGTDNGVSILYGKNLVDVNQEESIAGAVTGIYPYWAGGDGDMVELPEKTMQVQSALSYPRVVPLDLSSEFKEQPSAQQLRKAAEDYISRNGTGKPKVTVTVDFVQLWQTAGYEDIAGLERVSLCDTVTVKFDRLGIDTKAKVIKIVYDCLKERYSKIELGDAKFSLAETIVNQQEEIEATPSASLLEQAIAHATKAITGASGGYVVLNPSMNPQEILIMDSPDKETAVNVWRWNSGGLGHSHSGYNGPFSDVALTADGQIVADRITSGRLNASIIRSGRIQSPHNRNVYFDLDSGEIRASTVVSSDGGAGIDIGTAATSLGTTTGINIKINGVLMGIVHSNGAGGLLIEDKTRTFGVLFGPDKLNISASGSSLTVSPQVGISIGKNGDISIISSPVGKAQAGLRIYNGEVRVIGNLIY